LIFQEYKRGTSLLKNVGGKMGLRHWRAFSGP